VLIDSSVAIALLDSTDALHRPARVAVGDHRGAQLIASVLTYAETLVAPVARGGAVLESAEGFFREVIHHVEPVSVPIARRAAELRASGGRLDLPDALIIATGEELEVGRILTADARWPSLSERVELVVV
jgi:predicted nucleic acid-binding protein